MLEESLPAYPKNFLTVSEIEITELETVEIVALRIQSPYGDQEDGDF